ncbi:MAG TPA: hypothetical protein VGF25_08895 [Thermoleophilaceae bacterium]|jgi:hypothetical protein
MIRRCIVVALVAACVPSVAEARDPGRWTLTGYSSVPNVYWQGVTSDPGRHMWFDGVVEGLYGTRPSLVQTAGTDAAIPPAVKAAEGYNHIGDISWDPAEGGRVLLPLECYTPGGPNGGNTCGTGSIGVADARTLAWRYYVKLDPTEIPKAMWVERSPDGQLLWTSSGRDLLAYRAADVNPANAAPGAPPIHSVRRIAGAVPPSGITGAAFLGGRLYLAGGDTTPWQVWSVDLTTGARALEIELNAVGESEGLDTVPLLGGELHWLVPPLAIGQKPTFGPTSGLVHFARLAGRQRLRVKVRARGAAATRRVRLSVSVTRRHKAVRGASVQFAGRQTRTGRRGKAKLVVTLATGGRFRVIARKGVLRGQSKFVKVRPPAAAAAFTRPAR